MRCIIVGAGDFFPKKLDVNGVLVIAADGGRESLDKMGITPDICIGDFDSLGYVPRCKETVTLPCEKDVTDTFAAADLAIERGYDEKCIVRVLSEESVRYDKSGHISFISASDKAVISISGMKYSGERLEIRNDFPLGISNEYTKGAKITVHEGYVYEIRE